MISSAFRSFSTTGRLGMALVLLASMAAAQDTTRRGVSITVVPHEIRASQDFDAAQSTGLFVGIRHFDDGAFAEVPYAVDDAVDLAHLFDLELDLIAPRNVVLSLSGAPQKPDSQERLRSLLAGGVSRHAAQQSDVFRLVIDVGAKSGTRGLFVVAFATHGFSDQGGDFLVASDSLRRRVERTGVAVAEVLEDVKQSKAPRRLVLLDACRERLFPARGGAPAHTAMSRSFADAIAKASGQAVLSGTTAGGYSYDDPASGNGVFTAAVIDGLRGAAPADERSFITVRQLAGFVDRRVSEWVRLHRPEHAALSQGIALTLDAVAVAEMPLAVDPAGLKAAEKQHQRLDAALVRLRQNIGGLISGAMYDEMAEILRSPEFPRDLWIELVAEIEALDGTERLQRSLRDWYHEHSLLLKKAVRPPVPGDEWTELAVGMRFRYVPAGTFQMGSPEDEAGRQSYEQLHTVTLTRNLWMGETEVTQKQWQRLMGNNPSYSRLVARSARWSIAVTAKIQPTAWVSRKQILGDCATCWAMCRSGSRTQVNGKALGH